MKMRLLAQQILRVSSSRARPQMTLKGDENDVSCKGLAPAPSLVISLPPVELAKAVVWRSNSNPGQETQQLLIWNLRHHLGLHSEIHRFVLDSAHIRASGRPSSPACPPSESMLIGPHKHRQQEAVLPRGLCVRPQLGTAAASWGPRWLHALLG